MADKETKDAPKAAAPAAEAPKTTVEEAPVIATDTVITDPNDPLAVQVPDAVKEDLPIVAAAGPSPEEVFSKDS